MRRLGQGGQGAVFEAEPATAFCLYCSLRDRTDKRLTVYGRIKKFRAYRLSVGFEGDSAMAVNTSEAVTA